MMYRESKNKLIFAHSPSRSPSLDLNRIITSNFIKLRVITGNKNKIKEKKGLNCVSFVGLVNHTRNSFPWQIKFDF